MAHNPMGKDPADYESQPIFNATTQKYNMINTRTGLFEACINMPTVTGNSGCGPVFDPSLFYSPTTNNLNAIGDGWEFCFTLFSEAYKVLTLHTGETLKLEKGKNLKQPAVIVEWGNDDTLTVYRKGGRTEVLFKLGDTSFYVPQSLTTDGYNYLYFSWIATPHIIDGKTYYQIKLQTVKDKLRTLINIDYTLAEEGAQPAKTPATLTYWPDDSVETLRYVLTIEDYALKSVKLADGIETKLEYLDHKTAGWLLITYTSPDNQVEEIEYSDNGLYFPDNPQLSALPCAVDHHLRPNGGGEMVPTFLKYEKESNHKTYTTTKFSLDRIIAYKYDAITNEILSETVTRTYEGKPAITTTKYTLSAEPNAIKNEQSVTYSKDGKSRTANMHTRFDKDAALISNTQSGKTTSYQYYDEGKFLSNKLISETLSRSALLNFPIHEKKYLYTSISDMSETPLFHVQENYYSVSIPLSKTTFQTYDYFEDNDFRKGKPKSINLGGDLYKAITRNFEYTLGGVNGTELTTIETLVDETEELKPERKSSTTQSTLSGRLIRQVDTDGNHAEYTYDAFGRLASLTLCAQSPTYKQTTTYAYPAPGQVKSTEPNGRVRLSEYDGQDRLVREYEYTTATTKRLLKEISYNDKGQELRTTEYDYVADGTAISEWSQNVYDAWGEIGGQLHSDGRQTFKLYDPVALTLTEWAGKATDKHRKVTTYKPDETIEKIEFLDQAGAIFQTQNATYTLNNQVQQLRTHNEFGVNTVDYTYDHYGRVLTEAHVEDDKGLLPLLNLAYTYHYTYQPFSPSDEPATLEISFGIGLQKHRLGTREFDNWERVTSLVRGTLEETYTYDGTSPAPATKKTADGTILEYEYIKELGNKPSKVSKAQSSLQKTFSYAYAGQSASRAVEGESVLENSHNRDLLVTRQQVQTKDGQSKAVSYSYSPAGRLLRETDVFGTSTEFLYSPGGQRIRSTNQFFTRHEYDDQGQLKQEVVETRSGATQRVEVTYTYDAQQREISRRFVPMENTPVGVEIATTYYADGKFKQVQLKRGSTVLGSRNFTYTAGGRLKSCETAGVWRPKNPKGALIDKQQFTYDGMGNVLTCVSTFAGAHNTATYTYNNSMSFRLEGIKNTHADYTKSATITYDTAGRVSQDLNGRKYTYDGLGRLVQAGSTRYRYDPDDRLMTRNEGADERQVIYNDLKASGEYATENNASYRHLSPGSAACYAQRTKMSGARLQGPVLALLTLTTLVVRERTEVAGVGSKSSSSPMSARRLGTLSKSSLASLRMNQP